jgi:hypothetical protein
MRLWGTARSGNATENAKDSCSFPLPACITPTDAIIHTIGYAREEQNGGGQRMEKKLACH